MSWLTALSAMAAMAIHQLFLPAAGKGLDRGLLRSIDRAGAFITNLTAIAGLIALSFGLLSFVRYSSVIRPRQRMIVGFVAMCFLPIIATAALFERHRITAQVVLLALGLAHMLSAHVSLCAARATPRLYERGAALLAATMAILAMSYQLLEQVAALRITAWQAQLQTTLQHAGEACYLLLLVGMAPLLLPTGKDMRSRLARAAGFGLLPIVLGALYLAERTLSNDYALLLYHAQRVTLFIDSWPRLYSLPIGIALASSFSAALSSDSIRRQAGAGVVLLLASGYAPHAPGRLLTSALALVLIARAIIARAHPDASSNQE